MIDVYIGLGSNLSLPKQQLFVAFTSLAKLPNSILRTQSSLYQSQPMGPQDQPDYVNAVAMLTTELSAQALLKETQQIENEHGRVRKAERWGARTLDLDILLYGNQQFSTETLTIPHYGMKQREFVLYPLHEIAPELILPDGEKLVDILAQCPSNGLQRISDSAHI